MAQKPQLQFITKDGGCSLCDDAWEEIEAAQDYVEFDIDIIKLHRGHELYERYYDKIPVILIDGKLAFTYRTTRDQLIKRLQPKKPWQFWK